MTLRGQAAIVGIGELPTRRTYPGRTTYSLCAEATRLAMTDAGLRKEDIDGLVTRGSDISPMDLAEYMGLRVGFCEGVTQHGASGAHSVVVAASAIYAGLADTVLCVLGGSRDPAVGGFGPGIARGLPPASKGTEFEAPFGPAAGANTGYALMKRRHMYEFGSTQEQFAKMAVNQRFNALNNPNAVFQGQPSTIDDVLNSRMVNDPLHLLECVMPCGGAAACIVTSAERAKSFLQPPVYLLGAGASASDHDTIWQSPRMTTTPVVVSARKAYEMAGYGPKDIQFAEFYDWYTILAAVCLEDAGFCKKGEIGPFFDSVDTTYKGSFPVNTDGGQISGGQPVGGAGGFRHVIEAARQIMGRAGERQVAKNDLAMVNGWGGTASVMCTLILGSEAAR